MGRGHRAQGLGNIARVPAVSIHTVHILGEGPTDGGRGHLPKPFPGEGGVALGSHFPDTSCQHRVV